MWFHSNFFMAAEKKSSYAEDCGYLNVSSACGLVLLTSEIRLMQSLEHFLNPFLLNVPFP